MKANHADQGLKDPVQVTLDRLTAYLTGHLVQMWTSKDMKDQVKVDVLQATDCLLVSAAHTSLIRLEGEVSDEQKMQNRFGWANSRNNAYSNFEPMLDQDPDRAEQMPTSWLPYDRDKWSQVFQDEGHWYGKVKFPDPVDDLTLTKVVPADFRVPPGENNPQGYGVEVGQLPRPEESTRSAPSAP